MTTWPMVELGNVAELRGGATPRRDNATYWGGDIPWVTPTDLPAPRSGIADVANTANAITREGLASCPARILPPSTVLFSSRASIGKIGIAAVPLTTNQGFINLNPCRRLESRYLAWCLHFHADRIAALAGSTTFKEVSKSTLKRFRIPLPPLSEQRRIVEILDHADRIRELRVEAGTKADRILPALFIRMFGDPATNPMGWAIKRIGDVCTVVSGATPKTNRPEFWGGGIAWATPKDLSALEGWSLDHTKRTLTDEGLASCSATMMPAKSVLLSSRAPIGLVAVSGVPMCTNQGFKSLVCGPYIDPWYLFGWCNLRRTFLQSLGRGATFKEISKRIVESIEFPLPLVQKQRRFRANLHRLMSVERERTRSARRVADLLDVLFSRAFSGDLTASWRCRQMEVEEFAREMKQSEGTVTDAAP